MKKVIYSDRAPKAVGPYAHANATDEIVFVSGQLGLDPETGKMQEGVQAQAEQALKNLKAVLEDAGSSVENVLKTTVFLDDIGDFAKVNEIYATYFGENSPARSCFEVAALPMGGLVEIEAIAKTK